MYSIYVCIYILFFFLIEVYVDMVIQSTKGRIHQEYQEYGIALTTRGRKYRCEKGHGGDVIAKWY